MSDLAMSLLTVLTPTLILMTWQQVSDSMSDFFLLSSPPLWSCLLDSKWVVPCKVQLCPLLITIFTSCWLDREWVTANPISLLTVPTSIWVLLAWQEVGDSMPGPFVTQVSTVLTFIMGLLAWQLASDSMPGLAVSDPHYLHFNHHGFAVCQ